MKNDTNNIKKTLNSISKGLIIYQSEESQGLSGLCHIIDHPPSNKKVYGVFENINSKSFKFKSVKVDLKKGLFYPKLIDDLEPASENQFIIVENPRDKETFSSIFELIEQNDCAVLIWLRGPGQKKYMFKSCCRI